MQIARGERKGTAKWYTARLGNGHSFAWCLVKFIIPRQDRIIEKPFLYRFHESRSILLRALFNIWNISFHFFEISSFDKFMKKVTRKITWNSLLKNNTIWYITRKESMFRVFSPHPSFFERNCEEEKKINWNTREDNGRKLRWRKEPRTVCIDAWLRKMNGGRRRDGNSRGANEWMTDLTAVKCTTVPPTAIFFF